MLEPDWKLLAVKWQSYMLPGGKQEFSALTCVWQQTQWICFRALLKSQTKATNKVKNPSLNTKQTFTVKHSVSKSKVLCVTKYYSTWKESRYPPNRMHPKISCDQIKITKAYWKNMQNKKVNILQIIFFVTLSILHASVF